LVFFVCLLPLALYSLFLAWINGNRRAWIVSGTWDFAGVLLAVSGLLVAGGPAILTGLSEDWRNFWIGTQGKPWARLGAESPTNTYLVFGITYFVLVIFLAGATLWRRRLTTIIYNLNTDAFELVLAQVMESMGLKSMRSGNLICWQSRPLPGPIVEVKNDSPARGYADTAIQLAPALPRAESETTSVALRDLDRSPPVTQTLRLELSPSLCYACLHWSAVHDWPRAEIEEELKRHRTQLEAHENPLSFWLMIVATIFIFGIFVGMVTMLILSIIRTGAAS
jgi:hypothetical protein